MTSYLLQERDGETGGRNPYRPNGQLVWTPWRTVRKEIGDEHGGARAEVWLLSPVRGITQRRLKREKWVLTREECQAAHREAQSASLNPQPTTPCSSSASS